MAIKVSEKFGSRANPPSSDYQYGSIKDETISGVSNDGTPLDAEAHQIQSLFKEITLGLDYFFKGDAARAMTTLNAIK